MLDSFPVDESKNMSSKKKGGKSGKVEVVVKETKNATSSSGAQGRRQRRNRIKRNRKLAKQENQRQRRAQYNNPPPRSVTAPILTQYDYSQKFITTKDGCRVVMEYDNVTLEATPEKGDILMYFLLNSTLFANTRAASYFTNFEKWRGSISAIYRPGSSTTQNGSLIHAFDPDPADEPLTAPINDLIAQWGHNRVFPCFDSPPPMTIKETRWLFCDQNDDFADTDRRWDSMGAYYMSCSVPPVFNNAQPTLGTVVIVADLQFRDPVFSAPGQTAGAAIYTWSSDNTSKFNGTNAAKVIFNNFALNGNTGNGIVAPHDNSGNNTSVYFDIMRPGRFFVEYSFVCSAALASAETPALGTSSDNTGKGTVTVAHSEQSAGTNVVRAAISVNVTKAPYTIGYAGGQTATRSFWPNGNLRTNMLAITPIGQANKVKLSTKIQLLEEKLQSALQLDDDSVVVNPVETRSVSSNSNGTQPKGSKTPTRLTSME